MNNTELLLIISPIFLTIALFFVILKLNSKIKDISWYKKVKINIQEPYRTFLLDGSKIIEWRLNRWKWKDLQIWDILQLDDSENIEFEVWTKRKYTSFKELLEKEWLWNVLPDKNSIEEWLKDVYYKFYTKEDEQQYGVVAIEVRKI